MIRNLDSKPALFLYGNYFNGSYRLHEPKFHKKSSNQTISKHNLDLHAQYWQTLFPWSDPEPRLCSSDYELTAMTRTDTGLAIVVSGKPAFPAMQALPMQIISNRLHCRLRRTGNLAVIVFRFAPLHCEPVPGLGRAVVYNVVTWSGAYLTYPSVRDWTEAAQQSEIVHTVRWHWPASNWTYASSTEHVHAHVCVMTVTVHAHVYAMRAVMCWNIADHFRMLSITCAVKKKDHKFCSCLPQIKNT